MRFCRVFDDFGGGADAPQPAAKALRRIAAQQPAALPSVVVDLGRVAERAAQAVADIQARAHTWGLRSAAAQPEPKGAAALFAPIQRAPLAVTPVSPIAGEVFRLYVSAGARPVAVRSIAAGGATSVQYLHPDHLGSIGQITDANRNWVQDVYFKPYGGVRWAQSGILGPDSDSATRRSYTGQYEEKSQWLGSLMHYKARYYSPFLHRFTQPDTIVPNPGNPQDLNRFTYSFSNPINYTDPSGHIPNPSCTGTTIADCGVDGWYGSEDFETKQTLLTQGNKAGAENIAAAGIATVVVVGAVVCPDLCVPAAAAINEATTIAASYCVTYSSLCARFLLGSAGAAASSNGGAQQPGSSISDSIRETFSRMKPGESRNVWEATGGIDAARAEFDSYVTRFGGTVMPQSNGALVARFADGTSITFMEASSYLSRGQPPTLYFNNPIVGYIKAKYYP